MFAGESDLDYMVPQLNEDPDLLSKLVAAVPGLQHTTPPIEVLAAYKDKMRISDHNWPETVKTFGLGAYAKITAIRKQREKDNSSMAIQPVGEVGYEIPLLPYLQHLLKQNPPGDPNKPVIVKFAFDGATMTSGKRIQQELGGLQILTPGEPLASVKSPKSCHVHIIYIGGETDEELRESLANLSTVHFHLLHSVVAVLVR